MTAINQRAMRIICSHLRWMPNIVVPLHVMSEKILIIKTMRTIREIMRAKGLEEYIKS
jgi:hypothetical protein